MYISYFLNRDNRLMSYSQFRNKCNLEITDISSKAYVDIKLALRKFNCPSEGGGGVQAFYFGKNYFELGVGGDGQDTF